MLIPTHPTPVFRRREVATQVVKQERHEAVNTHTIIVEHKPEEKQLEPAQQPVGR